MSRSHLELFELRRGERVLLTFADDRHAYLTPANNKPVDLVLQIPPGVFAKKVPPRPKGLVLVRRSGQATVIELEGGDVMFAPINAGRSEIAIEAPDDIHIRREELEPTPPEAKTPTPTPPAAEPPV
jgi:sRNA-binding carbon storage regulator CsrA